MKDIPKYYSVLFQAVESAINTIEAQNFGLAKQLLIAGEQEAEDAYLAEEEIIGMEQCSIPFLFYSAFKSPVASLNSSISASSSFACAWTASQVCSVSYHWALRSSTSMPCCSTQV